MSHNTKTLYFKPRVENSSPFIREFAIVKITPEGLGCFTRIASYRSFDKRQTTLRVAGENSIIEYLSECGWVPCPYEDVVRGRLLWNNQKPQSILKP